jgi:hypothetical protein
VSPGPRLANVCFSSLDTGENSAAMRCPWQRSWFKGNPIFHRKKPSAFFLLRHRMKSMVEATLEVPSQSTRFLSLHSDAGFRPSASDSQYCPSSPLLSLFACNVPLADTRSKVYSRVTQSPSVMHAHLFQAILARYSETNVPQVGKADVGQTGTVFPFASIVFIKSS